MDIVQTITIILSSLAAILAWVAKIRWSNQFIKSKDEQIKSFETHIKHLVEAKDGEIKSLKTSIEQLKEFSPIKLREYYLSVKEQLEEYNEYLKDKLQKANIELSNNEGGDDRFNKILEMIVGIDVKTNKYLEELNAYSDEIQIIQRAIRDDSFELPGVIIKPNRDEIEKYITKKIPAGITKNKSTIDLSEWASKNHPAYKNQ